MLSEWYSLHSAIIEEHSHKLSPASAKVENPLKMPLIVKEVLIEKLIYECM